MHLRGRGLAAGRAGALGALDHSQCSSAAARVAPGRAGSMAPWKFSISWRRALSPRDRVMPAAPVWPSGSRVDLVAVPQDFHGRNSRSRSLCAVDRLGPRQGAGRLAQRTRSETQRASGVALSQVHPDASQLSAGSPQELLLGVQAEFRLCPSDRGTARTLDWDGVWATGRGGPDQK